MGGARRSTADTIGEAVEPQLLTLIDLQGFDTRIAALEADAARLPKQIEALHASLAEAKSSRPFIPFQRLVDEPQPP